MSSQLNLRQKGVPIMEMERINDDTIRVVVTNDDLAERSISVIDLLGNQEEIERFFYNILEEVDVNHDFENNEAVTFQVLPNRNGLELFISKNIGDKAMMDGVINSMFGNRTETDLNDDVSESLLAQLLDNDGVEEPKPAAKNTTGDAQIVDKIVQAAQEVARDQHDAQQIIVKFKDFEAVIQLAKMLKTMTMPSRLMDYHQAYYLELTVTDIATHTQIQDVTAIVREYGEVVTLAPEVLTEHGKVIFKADALEQILELFK